MGENLTGRVDPLNVDARIEKAIDNLDLQNTYDAKGSAKNVQDALDSYKTSNNLSNQELSDRIDNLVLNSGDSPAEVTDAHLDANGKAYNTLKERLDTENSELKSDLADLIVGVQSVEVIENSYVEENGEITSYNGWKRTDYIDCQNAKYIHVYSSVKDSKYNCFFDANKNFISCFFTTYYNYYTETVGYINSIPVPPNACYVMLSNTNAGMDATSIESMLNGTIRSINSEYDCYIASSNSKFAKFADFICYGNRDQDIINKAISDDRIKSIYFYPDSEFVLSAPILPKDNLILKSNGAKFTTPNMVVHNVASTNDSLDNTLIVDSKDGFCIGMYLYLEDDDGNNDFNIITRIDASTPPKLTLKNNHKNSWLVEKNPVVKSASPCIMVSNCKNVTIDGINIDWNVENNPIQTYNPWYLQEGISIDESEYVTIKNCIINNGGRRGISTYDAKYVHIDNCYIDNWKEHAIDIFNSYSKNGNTTEYPILQNSVISNTTCTNCSMAGIQNHRGSGIVIKGCVCEGNTYGIRTQEYAHDVDIIGNILVGNNHNGAYISQDCFNINVSNNIIAKNDWEGIITYKAHNVIISNNNITKNYRAGIKIDESSRCNAIGNMLNNNNIICESNTVSGEYGGAIVLFKAEKNKVANNSIDQNGGNTDYGVWENNESNKNIVSDNMIIGNMVKDGIHLVGTISISRNNDLIN